MIVVAKKIGHFYAVTDIWLCKEEVQKLLNGKDVGLKCYGEWDKPTPFHQDVTVHRHEVGKDNALYVEGLDDTLIAGLKK